MPDFEGEAEALEEEEFGGFDVVFSHAGFVVWVDAVDEASQGEVEVVGFAGEEKAAEQNGFGVVGHGAVGEVEAA
jgi:hypothetical protein